MNRVVGKSFSLVVSIITLQMSAPAWADSPVTFRTVVLEGQVAPGMDEGLTFDGFSYPAIDRFGRIAVKAGLAGPGITTDNNESYWTEGPSGLSLRAREGAFAPGTEPDTVFRLVGASIPLPTYSQDGNLALRLLVQGPNVNGGNNAGIWMENSGSMELAVRTGNAAPGFPAGSFFNTLTSAHPLASANGHLAFPADVYNPEFVDPYHTIQHTLWTYNTNDGLSSVARQGDAAPGTVPGNYFDEFLAQSLKPDGSPGVLFKASLDGPGIPFGGAEGLWLNTTEGTAPMALSNEPAPGLPGHIFGNFFPDRYPINNSGQTAFTAFASQRVSPYNDALGLWAGGVGSLSLIAKEGDPAPGLQAGVTLTSIHNQNNYIPVSDSGKVAFKAGLAGPGINLLYNDAILSDSSGDLAIVAREGEHAPGTPDGVLFKFLQIVGINSVGQTIFTSELTGSGVTSSNNIGVWAQDPEGVLQLILRRGDPFEVAPGDERTIGYINRLGVPNDGPSVGTDFNERGEIAFYLTFTDGTSGIFVAQVPEPASLLLLAFPLALAKRLRRLVR